MRGTPRVALRQQGVNMAALIAGGTIDHALVVCAFWWLAQHDPDRFSPRP